MTPAISIQGLELTYPSHPAPTLKGIDLDIAEGEFVVLTGPSGCGKTSLIRCLNGIIPHLLPANVSGGIRLNGKPIDGLSPQMISATVGSVFQDPRSQFFHINVTDEIAFGPENMGYPKQEICRRVDAAFDLFGINHLRDRKMFDLSSGERQKVIFAAVHAMGPSIYILDEPSANLDAIAISDLRGLLAALKAEGHTVVMVEHRLYYLAGLFDRLLILDSGKIVREVRTPEGVSPEEGARYGLRSMKLPPLVSDGAQSNGIAGPDTPGTENSLQVCGVGFRYQRGRTALEDISAHFPAGVKSAIVGPNASGKTTFIKLLGGLLRERSGSIRYGNQRLSAAHRLRRCGFVMQESGHQLFFPTVWEEVSSGFAKPVPRADIVRLLEEFDLADVACMHPQTLSGGQQQRLTIAVAMASRPDVLILDEPTSGLDARHMGQLVALLDREAGNGAIVVAVTHDLEFIIGCFDRILHVSGGKADSLCARGKPSAAVQHFFRSCYQEEKH